MSAVPASDWLLVSKFPAPAVKVPLFVMPPLKVMFGFEVTMVLMNDVEALTVTSPTKVVMLVLSESVKPPLVERVVAPVTVKAPIFELVTVTPVIATSLANERSVDHVIDWLLVLKVAPPAANEVPLLV